MLLSKLRQVKLPVSRLQYTLAIIVGSRGCSRLEEAILESKTSELEVFVDSAIAASGTKFINYAEAVVNYFSTVNALNIGGRSYTLYTFFTDRDVAFRMSTNDLALEILKYQRDYSLEQLHCAFLYSSACTEMVKKKIYDAYRNKFGITIKNLTTAKINSVFKEFADYYKKYSASGCRYNSNADNPFGWVTRSFDFFGRNHTNFTDVLNERNQDALIGDDRGSTMLELSSIKSNKESVIIDFPEVVSKIAKASNLLYNHKGNSESYYDIFTHYVAGRADQLCARIKSSLGKYQNIIVHNGWRMIDNSASHVSNKFHSRSLIANEMMRLVDSALPITEINKLYKRVLATNEAIPLNNDGSIKDGMRLFDAKNISVRSKLTNGEKFEILYNGFEALREFIRYLDYREISIYSISPAIFRDLRFPRRYYNLDEYLRLEKRVEKLFKEAKDSNETINGIFSNDKLFDMLSLGFADTSVLYNYLVSSCKLGDIRSALQVVKEKEIKENYSKRAVTLYRKYKHEDSYIKLGMTGYVSTNKTVWQLLLTDKQMHDFNDMCSRARGDRNVKVIQLPIYPKHDNYIKLLDPMDLNEITADYKSTFINAYARSLNGDEKTVIQYGTFSEMPTKELFFCYNWFIGFLVSEIQDLQKGISIDPDPIKYVIFLNILEAMMEREGHPVMKNGYYNLESKTLDDEFAYMLNATNGAANLARRKYCIVHCARMLRVPVGDTKQDWEVLHNLFVVSSVLQFMMKQTVQSLHDISHEDAVMTSKEFSSKQANLTAYNKWQHDGAFASLVRSTSHYHFISLFKKIKLISDFPFVSSINLYGVYPYKIDNYLDFERNIKSLIVNTVNRYLDAHKDVAEFFNDLTLDINEKFYASEENAAIVEVNTNERELKNAAESLTSSYKIEDAASDIFTKKLRVKLCAIALTDPLGYVVCYNKRFRTDLADGSKAYLHSYGYWVIVSKTGFKIKPVTQNEYNSRIKVMLNVY